MKQTKHYLGSLRDQCAGLSDEELLNMANSIDDRIGMLLFYSFKNSASYESVERAEARHGRIVPISKNVFYIRRRRYINSIEQRLAAAAAGA